MFLCETFNGEFVQVSQIGRYGNTPLKEEARVTWVNASFKVNATIDFNCTSTGGWKRYFLTTLLDLNQLHDL